MPINEIIYASEEVGVTGQQIVLPMEALLSLQTASYTFQSLVADYPVSSDDSVNESTISDTLPSSGVGAVESANHLQVKTPEILFKELDELNNMTDASLSLGVSSSELHNILCNSVHKLQSKSDICRDIAKDILHFTIEDISKWAGAVGSRFDTSDDDNKHKITKYLPEAIAVMIKSVFLVKGYIPKLTQLMALVSVILSEFDTNTASEDIPNHGKLLQIATGEGKSLITAMSAVLRVLLYGEKVDVVTSSPLLSIRDLKGATPLFKLFGIRAESNIEANYDSGTKACYAADVDIVYGDASTFQFDYLREEYSGLGTKGGRGFDKVSVIIDEVDSMLLDEGAKIAKLATPLIGAEYLEPVFIAIWQMLQNIELSLEDYFVESVRDRVIKYLENYIDELIHGKRLNDGMFIPPVFKIPKHLQEFMQEKIHSLAVSAVLARILEEDKNYVIKKGEIGYDIIAPIDYDNTGIIHDKTSWSCGLQQFLQIKHGLRLEAEGLSCSFISNVNYFRKYTSQGGHIYGLTGTLGSDESRHLLEQEYGISCGIIPTYHELQLIAYHQDIVAISCVGKTSADMQNEAIINSATTYAKDKERVVLIIAETIAASKELHGLLKKSGYNMNKVTLYNRSDLQSEETIAGSHASGEIIIATNMAGRGTDIELTDEVKANGGLHVITGFLPKNLRVELQAIGRAGRQGENGSAQMIIDGELESIKLGIKRSDSLVDYLQARDTKEKARLAEIGRERLRISEFEDVLFNRFNHEIYQIVKARSDILQGTLDAIEERWGLWLHRISQQLKAGKIEQPGTLEEFALAEFSLFKNEIFNKLDSSNHKSITLNPAHLASCYYEIIDGQKLSHNVNVNRADEEAALYLQESIRHDNIYNFAALYDLGIDELFKTFGIDKKYDDHLASNSKEHLESARHVLRDEIIPVWQASLLMLGTRASYSEIGTHIVCKILLLQELLQSIESNIKFIEENQLRERSGNNSQVINRDAFRDIKDIFAAENTFTPEVKELEKFGIRLLKESGYSRWQESYVNRDKLLPHQLAISSIIALSNNLAKKSNPDGSLSNNEDSNNRDNISYRNILARQLAQGGVDKFYAGLREQGIKVSDDDLSKRVIDIATCALVCGVNREEFLGDSYRGEKTQEEVIDKLLYELGVQVGHEINITGLGQRHDAVREAVTAEIEEAAQQTRQEVVKHFQGAELKKQLYDIIVIDILLHILGNDSELSGSMTEDGYVNTLVNKLKQGLISKVGALSETRQLLESTSNVSMSIALTIFKDKCQLVQEFYKSDAEQIVSNLHENLPSMREVLRQGLKKRETADSTEETNELEIEQIIRELQELGILNEELQIIYTEEEKREQLIETAENEKVIDKALGNKIVQEVIRIIAHEASDTLEQTIDNILIEADQYVEDRAKNTLAEAIILLMHTIELNIKQIVQRFDVQDILLDINKVSADDRFNNNAPQDDYRAVNRNEQQNEAIIDNENENIQAKNIEEVIQSIDNIDAYQPNDLFARQFKTNIIKGNESDNYVDRKVLIIFDSEDKVINFKEFIQLLFYCRANNIQPYLRQNIALLIQVMGSRLYYLNNAVKKSLNQDQIDTRDAISNQLTKEVINSLELLISESEYAVIANILSFFSYIPEIKLYKKTLIKIQEYLSSKELKQVAANILCQQMVNHHHEFKLSVSDKEHLFTIIDFLVQRKATKTQYDLSLLRKLYLYKLRIQSYLEEQIQTVKIIKNIQDSHQFALIDHDYDIIRNSLIVIVKDINKGDGSDNRLYTKILSLIESALGIYQGQKNFANYYQQWPQSFLSDIKSILMFLVSKIDLNLVRDYQHCFNLINDHSVNLSSDEWFRTNLNESNTNVQLSIQNTEQVKDNVSIDCTRVNAIFSELRELNKEHQDIVNLIEDNYVQNIILQVEQSLERDSSLFIQGSNIHDWDDKHIKAWSDQIRGNKNLVMENLPEVIAVIFKANQLITGHNLRITQIISVVVLLQSNNGRLAEIATGEGKSTITAALAIIFALCGRKIDIITSSSVLAVRDSQEQNKFYQMLGINCTHNISEGHDISKPKDCYQAEVIYGDVSNYQYDYLRDSYNQYNTKNGREFDICLVDEVDSMLLDEGSKIAMLSENIYGMEYLEPLLVAIWQQLLVIESKYTKTKNGKLLWINGEFHNENGEIVLFGATSSDAVFIVSDHKDFSLQLIEDYIDSLLDCSSVNIPDHLSNFVQQQIKPWACSVLNSYYMEEDKDYLIKLDKRGEYVIVPVDYDNTGVVQPNLQWSNGTHQFLQIKHGLKIQPETLTSCFISNMSYFRKYGARIYGMSGTLGSKASQKLLHNIYGVDFIQIPTFKPKKFSEDKAIFTKNNIEHQNNIIAAAIKQASLGRAVLVILETIRECQVIVKLLHNQCMVNQILEYYLSDDQTQSEILLREILPGQIIVATNLAGRGTDIKTSSMVEKNGGLHVILGYLPNNIRVEKQAFGRTARQGNNGTGMMILDENKMSRFTNAGQENDITVIKEKRDEREKEYLADINEHKSNKLRLEDELFEEFRDLTHKLKKIGNDAAKLSQLTEHWGQWLKPISNEKRYSKSREEEVRSEFAKFKQEMEEAYIKNDIMRNPIYLIKAGMDLVFAQKYLKACEKFAQAAKLDNKFTFGAHYNYAYSILRHSGYNKKPNIAETEDALNHLLNTKDQIENNIIPLWQSMLIMIGYNKSDGTERSRMNESPLAASLHNKIDLLNKQLEYIVNAIHVIESGYGTHRIRVKNPVFLDRLYPTNECPHTEINELNNAGIYRVFETEAKKVQKNYLANIAIAALGIAQIIIGTIIVIGSAAGTPIASFGWAIIAEGVSDIYNVVQATIKGQALDMGDYLTEKAISYAAHMILLGIETGKNVAQNAGKEGLKQGAKEAAKQGGKELAKKSITETAKKTAMKEIGKQIGKQIVKTIVVEAVQKKIGKIMNHELNNVRTTAEKKVRDKIRDILLEPGMYEKLDYLITLDKFNGDNNNVEHLLRMVSDVVNKNRGEFLSIAKKLTGPASSASSIVATVRVATTLYGYGEAIHDISRIASKVSHEFRNVINCRYEIKSKEYSITKLIQGEFNRRTHGNLTIYELEKFISAHGLLAANGKLSLEKIYSLEARNVTTTTVSTDEVARSCADATNHINIGISANNSISNADTVPVHNGTANVVNLRSSTSGSNGTTSQIAPNVYGSKQSWGIGYNVIGKHRREFIQTSQKLAVAQADNAADIEQLRGRLSEMAGSSAMSRLQTGVIAPASASLASGAVDLMSQAAGKLYDRIRERQRGGESQIIVSSGEGGVLRFEERIIKETGVAAGDENTVHINTKVDDDIDWALWGGKKDNVSELNISKNTKEVYKESRLDSDILINKQESIVFNSADNSYSNVLDNTGLSYGGLLSSTAYGVGGPGSIAVAMEYPGMMSMILPNVAEAGSALALGRGIVGAGRYVAAISSVNPVIVGSAVAVAGLGIAMYPYAVFHSQHIGMDPDFDDWMTNPLIPAAQKEEMMQQVQADPLFGGRASSSVNQGNGQVFSLIPHKNDPNNHIFVTPEIRNHWRDQVLTTPVLDNALLNNVLHTPEIDGNNIGKLPGFEVVAKLPELEGFTVIDVEPVLIFQLDSGDNHSKEAKKLGLKDHDPTSKHILDNIETKTQIFIDQNRKGKILREFPSEYLDKSLKEIMIDAKSNAVARKAKKLLKDGRFKK